MGRCDYGLYPLDLGSDTICLQLNRKTWLFGTSAADCKFSVFLGRKSKRGAKKKAPQ